MPRVRIEGNRSIHPAHFDADLVDGSDDKVRNIGIFEAVAPLDVGIEASFLVQELPIDWWRSDSAGRHATRFADVHRPDRHATALSPAFIEVGDDAGTSASTPLAPRGHRVFGGVDRSALFELHQLAARGENIRRKHGDVFERPRQQRRDDVLRDARRAILFDNEAIASHLGQGAARPGLEP